MHREAARGAGENARVLHRAHGLAVESRVIDRDRCVIGEGKQELFVVRVEAALRDIEDADRADDETVRETWDGDDVAGGWGVGVALPERVRAGGGDAAEGVGGGNGEIARIPVRRGDHHRALLDESEACAARMEQLRGVSHDEGEHAIELEGLVDALYNLRERTRFTRALLGAHERMFGHDWRHRSIGTAGSRRAGPHVSQHILISMGDMRTRAVGAHGCQ